MSPVFETPKRFVAVLLGALAFAAVSLESVPIARETMAAGDAIEQTLDNLQARLRGSNPDKPTYTDGTDFKAHNPDGTRHYHP